MALVNSIETCYIRNIGLMIRKVTDRDAVAPGPPGRSDEREIETNTRRSDGVRSA